MQWLVGLGLTYGVVKEVILFQKRTTWWLMMKSWYEDIRDMHEKFEVRSLGIR